MRNKNPILKKEIERFVDDFYDMYHKVPTLVEIGDATGISDQTVMRYLVEMSSEGTLEYSKRNIITKHIKYLHNQKTACLPLVGLIPCGEPETEFENQGDFIEVPVSFIGSGSYYVLIADGDSMIDAGIDDGDMVIIRKTADAEYGKIIVALDENNQNTLKRYEFDKKLNRPYLHPENKKYSDIYSEKISIQGVAEKVIKDLI